VIVYGWNVHDSIAAGFDMFMVKAGLYSDECTIVFVLSLFTSATVCFIVATVQRIYGNVYRTRKFTELIAAKNGVDVAACEPLFKNLAPDAIWDDIAQAEAKTVA
jgi:hypothetical protein